MGKTFTEAVSLENITEFPDLDAKPNRHTLLVLLYVGLAHQSTKSRLLKCYRLL